MLLKIFISSFAILAVLCHKEGPKVSFLENHGINGDENEMVIVDVKKHGTEDILSVQIRIHMIGGRVNVDGKPVKHGVVNAVHMRATLLEIKEANAKPERRLVNVILRVLVEEKTASNGKKVLIVEEEFVKVEGHDVLQVNVKHMEFESSHISVTTIKLVDSKIHYMPKKQDKHMYYDRPRHPDHGFTGGRDDDEMYDGGYHHHRHHRGFKCWYRKLSTTSKICLFSVGFLALITVVLFGLICVKRYKNRSSFEVTAPIDDTVAVDSDEEKSAKKPDAEKYDFHFQFDNTVVVDDKKVLIE